MAPWIDFEKIKREADFATVLRHYGLTVPEGRTQLKLRCPFHEDGTPSLSVNLAEKVWHCFGCGERGNVLRFVECMEALGDKRPSTRQAAVRVAAICGLTDYETERPVKGRARRPETTVGAGSGPETTERPSGGQPPLPAAPTGSQEPASRITAVTLGKLRAEIEAEFERDEPAAINPPLTFTLRLDPTHPYLAERGLAPATVEAFGLGYCRRGLMAGRVCIPIHDDAGELVAYAGRWVGPDATIPAGKDRYELPARFEKPRVLFNLHRVISEHLVLVEGFFPAFRLHTLGYPVVALMGRTLSEGHIELLERAGARRLTLLLDGDEPGRQAAAQIMGRLARTPFLTRAAVLPEGAQPDTVREPVLHDLLAAWR